jgi:hypothetical protein
MSRVLGIIRRERPTTSGRTTRLGRAAAAALIMLTLGVVAGGAMATIVSAGQGSPATPPSTTLVYTVSPIPHSPTAAAGPPPGFAPYFSVVPHPGMVQIQLVNLDIAPHAYLLLGTGFAMYAPPHTASTQVTFLVHPGLYRWINEIPSPGTPAGAPVGVLIVG